MQVTDFLFQADVPAGSRRSAPGMGMVIAGEMGRRVQSGSEQEQVEAVRGGG